eukprot:scaffold31153_cov22-Tisochrysis_lutea.AAC.1
MDDADELVLNLDYDVAKKPKVRYDCCKGMHTSSPEGEHAGPEKGPCTANSYEAAASSKCKHECRKPQPRAAEAKQ